jgi:hypothetical protein
VRALAALIAASIAVGSAAAAGPVVKRTSAGNATARAALLTAADLGKSWKAVPPKVQQAPGFSCRGYQPSEKGIVEIGAATSPSFSSGGTILQQYTGVYASAKQASTLWARAVKAGLADCAAQTLETIESRGIKVSQLASGTLTLPKPIPRTAGYRVTATLHAGGRALKTYFDVVLLSRGTTITEITISSFGEPVPSRSEQALAQIVAKRLGAPTA